MSKDLIKELRDKALADLEFFIELISPDRMLGDCHRELIRWWTREDAKANQLALLPRDHQKSAMMAYRVAWWITKKPTTRVLYISATSYLAELQLKMIKDILCSDRYQMYFPGYVNKEETKRERWTTSEISIDHPDRKAAFVRDPTILAAGLTSSLTGVHCDVAVLDDLVTSENASTADLRNKVRQLYSLLNSIESTDAKEWVIGTRYHENDLYSEIMQMRRDVYDIETGEVISTENIYEFIVKAVEDRGDGTGSYLWPRTRGRDGVWRGFDMNELAIKRGKYLDKTQFYSQYYNRPDLGSASAISRDKFQYYDQNNVKKIGRHWFHVGRKLNIVAGIDFAYSLSKRSDYTAIVVLGMDIEKNVFVLDIDRFQSARICDYFEHIMNMHSKWGFRKIRCETTGAQKAIVKELKDTYIRERGLLLTIEEHSPNRQMGSKEDRIRAALEPKYDNGQIWHYHGGFCSFLEEELMSARPQHDDIKDVMASTIEILTPPTADYLFDGGNSGQQVDAPIIHSRFGGVIG